MRRMRLVVIPWAAVVLARDSRIEGREDPIRVIAINPDVPIGVRLEHVRYRRSSATMSPVSFVAFPRRRNCATSCG